MTFVILRLVWRTVALGALWLVLSGGGYLTYGVPVVLLAVAFSCVLSSPFGGLTQRRPHVASRVLGMVHLSNTIRHVTRFVYDQPITESVMEARMQPRSDDTQRCLRFAPCVQAFVELALGDCLVFAQKPGARKLGVRQCQSRACRCERRAARRIPVLTNRRGRGARDARAAR